MEFCRGGQRFEIVRIRGQDEVAVRCQQDECGIDYVGHPSSSEQDSRPPSQCLVEAGDVDSRQQPRKARLTPRPTSPDLSHDATVGKRRAPFQELRLDERDGRSISPLDRDERSGIEQQAQRARPRRRATGFFRAREPRTRIASDRFRRPASRISSGVISPCSDS